MHTTHATVEVPKQEKVQNAQASIVVTGEREYSFSPFHWRQAIRQYLTCIWTNRCNAQETVDLTIPTYTGFGSGPDCRVHLRYLAVRTRYEAFGVCNETNPPSLRMVRRESVLLVTVNQPEQMEAALARFAWNRQMRVLGINLPNCSYLKELWLWSRPGRLDVFKKTSDSQVLFP